MPSGEISMGYFLVLRLRMLTVVKLNETAILME